MDKKVNDMTETELDQLELNLNDTLDKDILNESLNNYNTDVIQLEINKDELWNLFYLAHEEDITLNQLINKLLLTYIKDNNLDFND